VLRMSQGRFAVAASMLRTLARNPSALEPQHQDLLFVHLALSLASSDSVANKRALLSPLTYARLMLRRTR